MSRVLVIDDDAGTLLGYKGVLRASGYEVATAALSEDGVSATRRDEFDVVLCDHRLPDLSGVEVVRQIHESSPRSAIVLVTAWGSPELSIEAKRAGALMYAEKPLVGDELVNVVHGAMRLRMAGTVQERNPIGYAARRWADLVTRGVYVTDDPNTVLAWSRGTALARGTLQKRCDAVGITPKDSLDFVRLLRVVIHHAGQPWALQSWLDIADDRTARALRHRAGFGSEFPQVPDLECFFSHQRLIVRPDLIHALRSRLFCVQAPVAVPAQRGEFL